MRTIAKLFFVITLAGFLTSGVCRAMTEEENAKAQDAMKDYQFQSVTTKEGLHFDIPADMPIVTRNGVTGPIPFEEYQYFKLKKLDERLTSMETMINEKLASIEKKLDELRGLFADTKKITQDDKASSPQEKAGLLSST